MTWTKTGAEFPDDLANVDISDAGYRTHHEAITWLYTVERTDLLIPKHLVRRFAGSTTYEAAIKELVAHGFWQETAEHYELMHHADVIRASIAAQQNLRSRNKKAAKTYRRKHSEDKPVTDHVSDDVSADAVRQTDNHASKASTSTGGWPDVMEDR